MKKYFPYILLVGICLLFFYKTILFGKLPFPGDLLLAGYAPWNHQSYDGYVAGAIPTKNQYFDVIRELYPWKTIVVEQLKQGIMPLWNPYNFSGSPLLANYQSQVLYPFTFFYFLFPQTTAWTVMVIIQPLLGSVFLYMFATEIGLSSAAALLSAVLFNFSGFANVWMEFTTIWQTILWLPLLLYLVERGIRRKGLSIGQQLLFIFGLYSAITAGHPQDFINLFLLLCIYTLLRVKTKSQLLSPFLIVFSVPFLLAAPQLFPTIELFRSSARVAHDWQGIISHMLIQLWQLPLLAVSEFFGNPATHSSVTGDYVGKTISVGVVGFFLTIAALWTKQTSWYKKFFTFTAIVILLVTVRTPISELLYRYPWPVLSTGTPTRILFVLMFAMAMLAGLGYDALVKSVKFPLRSIVTVWILFLVFWAFVFAHPTFKGFTYDNGAIITMKRSMILATGILTILTFIIALTKYRKLLIMLLIPLATGELLYSFLKFNPFVPVSFVFPENKVIAKLQNISGIDRFWGYGTAAIEANFATQEHLFSPDGTDPLNLIWYNRFLQSSRDGTIAAAFDRTTRSDANLAPGYGEKNLPDNMFRLRIMDVLGIKYVLDRAENPKDSTTFAPDRFNNLGNIDDWTLYENRESAPRFFITGDVRPYTDAQNFESQFFSKNFKPGNTVLVNKYDFDGLPHFPYQNGTATLISYSPNNVKIQVTADSPGFLFLSDTYDYGWSATVNGKQSRVYKANYAFRGVIIPGGNSTVIFSYQPKSFLMGVVVSLITLCLTIIYFARLCLTEGFRHKTVNQSNKES